MIPDTAPCGHPGRRQALLSLSVLPPSSSRSWRAPGRAGRRCPDRSCPSPRTSVRSAACSSTKYPDWIAQAIYRDGSYAVFDGAKDLFKYLFNLRTYAPTKQAADVAALYVTDYYSLTLIDGRTAWYVIGSDVLGPMGRELIPLAAEKEARQFMIDHKGKRLLRFAEVTADVLKGLD